MASIEEDIYFQELCMLTGKVNRDKSYLFYLLVKDGSFFNKEKEESRVIQNENTVEPFDTWFNNL